MSLVYVQRTGEPPWQERRIVAGGNGPYIRYETTHDYIKGWCPECGKWKLFWITKIDRHIQQMWALGNVMPIFEEGQATYNGICTHGHTVENFSPYEKSEPKRWKRDSRNFDCDGRDFTTKTEYREWLDGFRHPEREAHYQPGHDCDTDCPMYEWEYGDW